MCIAVFYSYGKNIQTLLNCKKKGIEKCDKNK
jgi:hypothetical protein